MRILFATIPADGHFNPLTGIAKHLQGRGHDVRWYAGPTYEPRLRRLGIPSFSFDRAQEVTGANLATLFPERASLKGPGLIAFDMEKVFVSEVDHFARDITDLHERFPFDALFCDAAFYAAKLVGRITGIPVHVVGVSPLMATSRDVPPPFFGLRPGRTPLSRAIHGTVRTMLTRTLAPGTRLYNDFLGAAGIAPIEAGRWFDVSHEMATWYYQSGVPAMDYPRSDLPSNVIYVGPLLPFRRSPTDTVPHFDRIRSHRGPVIVVSQGTVDNDDPEKLIVPALEAMVDHDRHLVIATTGGRHTVELRRRFSADHVLIEDYLDFAQIFEHTDVFISNGGYGSVMLALMHGVPVVGAGKREGKNDVNARIGDRGLGIDLRTEHPAPRRLARAVDRVLGDDRIRRNVAEIRDQLAACDPMDVIASHLSTEPTVRA